MRIDKIKNLIFRKIQVLPKNFIKTRFSLLPYKQSIRKTVVLRIDKSLVLAFYLLLPCSSEDISDTNFLCNRMSLSRSLRSSECSLESLPSLVF